MRLERALPIGVLLLGALLSTAVIGILVAADEAEPSTRPTPSASVSPTPSPSAAASPSLVRGRVMDVATRADGTVAALGQTCDHVRCSMWVRWSSSGAARLAASPERPVATGSTTPNRLTLGAEGRAWLWAESTAGGPVWWTADQGQSWDRTEGSDYRAVAAGLDDAWLLRSTCGEECDSRMIRVGEGPDLATGRRLKVPDDPGTPTVLRRVGPDTAFLVIGDHLWRSTDAATSWTKLALPDPCGTHSLTVDVLASEVWLDCEDRPLRTGAPAALWRSRDQGATWERLPQPPAFHHGAALTTLSSQHALMTDARRAGVFETTDSGRTWAETLPFREDGYSRVLQTADGTLVTAPGGLAEGPGAVLHVRTPGSTTWTTLTLPA